MNPDDLSNFTGSLTDKALSKLKYYEVIIRITISRKCHQVSKFDSAAFEIVDFSDNVLSAANQHQHEVTVIITPKCQ